MVEVNTVLRHADFAPGENEDARDFVTESDLVFTTTNDNDHNNYSIRNGTSSEVPSYMILLTYALPVIIIMGTIGNMLSFLVLVRCQMRNTSVYFYLMTLAVADTCVLYLSAFKTWIRLIVGYELLHESDGVCKVVNFLNLFWLHLSAWLIVFVTVDRFVVVWFPFKASSVCTVTRSRVATTVLVIALIAYNSHFFWTYQLYVHPKYGTPTCGPPESMRRFMFGEFEFLKLSTYSLIPFAIILVLNVAIITRLHWRPFLLRGRSGDTTSTFSGASRTESATYGRQAKVTYMLVAVSFAWLVLTLPNAIHMFISKLVNADTSHMFRAISFLLMYTNHAINFYLYCITGKKFRRELEDLSKAACSRMKRPANGSTVCSPSRKTYGPRTNLIDIELHELVNT